MSLGPTVFSGKPEGLGRSESYFSVSRTAVRAGEYLRSPFAGPAGGPVKPGKIVATTDTRLGTVQAIGNSLQLQQEVTVIPPAGVRAVRGDRFLVYKTGDALVGHGRVVEPVGTVKVIDPALRDGGAVLASVDAMFSTMYLGDRLMPLDTLVAREGVFPVAVQPDLTGKVLWMQNAPLLPSIGQYLIFNAAALDGVVTGDQMTLVRERGKSPKGDQLPDEVLAVAQMLRVTQFGSSAIIIWVNDAGIEPGTLGRLTAKMQ
jgi:hypothetical protein